MLTVRLPITEAVLSQRHGAGPAAAAAASTVVYGFRDGPV